MGSDEGLEASDDAEWWSHGGRSPSGGEMVEMIRDLCRMTWSHLEWYLLLTFLVSQVSILSRMLVRVVCS